MAYQPFNLAGHTTLVTGGNGGIGYGMASALLASGAKVAIWGSRAEKTEAAKAKLIAECGDASRVFATTCDVSNEAELEAKFAETVKAVGGRIDSVFANAGVSGKGKTLMDASLEDWRRVQAVNVEGVFMTFRAAAKHMIETGGGGSLVATASTAAIEGAARNAAYGASKGAVCAFVRAVAVELARYKIRANSILPGWIETEMTDSSFNNEKFATNIIPRIPARRWGTWDDFGGIAVYLASQASTYHTGEQFIIDGGYTKF